MIKSASSHEDDAAHTRGLHRARLSANGRLHPWNILSCRSREFNAPVHRYRYGIILASQLEDVDSACLITIKGVGEVCPSDFYLKESNTQNTEGGFTGAYEYHSGRTVGTKQASIIQRRDPPMADSQEAKSRMYILTTTTIRY